MKVHFISRLAFIILAGLAVSPLCRAQSQLVGDWLGTVKAGDTQLHVAWHVVAAKDGSITSTIDNLDQKIYGLPVSSMTVKGDVLTLALDTVRVLDGDTIIIRGTFTGTINADATEIRGSWFQGQTLELDVKRVTMQAALNAVAQSQLAGDWLGTLNAGGAQLRLALHIAVARDGTLTATLDSLDQGATGIPVSSVDLKETQLTLGVPAVGGTYVGAVNKDATEIDGTWSQGQPLTLNFKRIPAGLADQPKAKAAAPSDIDGVWTGMLNAGSTELHIIFKIVNTQDGLTAQMQSPDQSPIWIAASSVSRDGSTLTITLKGIGVTVEGKIGADLGSIDSTFTQGAARLPLLLMRDKK
jgi:hypothetical protein